MQSRQLVVAVGLEEPGVSTATLKLWDVDRALAAAAASSTSSSSAAASPAPLRLHKLFSNKYPESEVTALAVYDPSSSSGAAAGHSSSTTAGSSSAPAAASLLIAVGLAAGSVYLFSADTAGPKGKLHHTGRLNARPEGGEVWRVSALAFTRQNSRSSSSSGGGGSGRKGAATTASAGTAAALDAPAAAGSRSKGQPQSQQQQPEPVWLYVVTDSQTLCFSMADNSKTILDQQGSPCGACAVVPGGLLVEARDDALYEYTTDTRAGCTAFDGEPCGVAGYSSVLAARHARVTGACLLHANWPHASAAILPWC